MLDRSSTLLALLPRRQLKDYEDRKAEEERQGAEEETVVGDWAILRVLGKGSFGRVVLAQRRSTGELAAIKLLPRGPLVRAAAGRGCRLGGSGWGPTGLPGEKPSPARDRRFPPPPLHTPRPAPALPAGATICDIRGARDCAPGLAAPPLCGAAQGDPAD